ncbi:LL-diaminopimelate aminotransferase [Oleidesulfovibrio alaskensis G20]|jgi:LL-diaminopimelate aminotransferase|uniref:LL-diaminopimelate aminotransferase n=1 Tax=Oleidesulfovibrio alaskensis (strain ATCC BAA-1058 / DSM 17464 / G20) TaxID=207559 RepID=DAPAT_OLEA2|nr:LL-diaminopimelate aminotransferase [Oleidesulfovibrio alaskensis]Q30ZX9.1 RecName: Full=LL-diaminopimelate aminotransferase; Short=DAP-AT; Short=DAP-aminotransferase; Short=LL-DAP-aminotransferase [Oleidesulfovibrio alaskensis G20]ABB38767.1 LL-diaminopimelate aminotransferase [Oleidesulfovibrio alaskensis G20]MBG0773072.1 LL-diaminopimelate aminotransferase [Oleidesulfovibrio alaskensis]
MTQFTLADRLATLPPYLFAQIDKVKAEVAARGVDIISLGIGDPDMPTPDFVIEALKKAAEKPANHQYPSYTGMLAFRQEVANWYKRRYAVELDPKTEVLTLIGSKEGIAHFPTAFVNPGDLVLVCPPCYPVYAIASRFMGGVVQELPLLEENDFLPDLDAVDEATWEKARCIFVNYPNNPTAAMAPRSFFEKLIGIARKHNVIVVHDAAYTEMYYNENNRPLSIMEIPGAMDVAIEFNSLSKPYNMTGWRIAMAVGNASLVAGLGKVKENMDSGAFQAVQEAAIVALRDGDAFLAEIRDIYRKRRDTVIAALNKIGITCRVPEASLYVWARVPEGYTSSDFVTRVLQETGVVMTPGNGFGAAGEGYFRISLTVNDERLEEAVSRIASL